jgi:hypothetical protein
VPRIAARFAVVVLALSAAACGGGNGNSDAKHRGTEAFPDVLEIARAELGDTAALHEVSVSETSISFVNVQIGRTVRVKYNPAGVATGNTPVRSRLNPTAAFPISDVAADAPAKLLAAIQEREEGEVSGFAATLARDRRGALVWKAKATVGGASKTYEAELDGTLRS